MLFLDRNGHYQTVRGCPLFYLSLFEELLVIFRERCEGISTTHELEDFYQNAPGGKSLIDRLIELHSVDPDCCSTENLIELLFDPGLLLIKSCVASHKSEVNTEVDSDDQRSEAAAVNSDFTLLNSDLFDSVATSIVYLVTLNLAPDLKSAIALAKTTSASELRLYQKARYRQLHPEIEEKEDLKKESARFMDEISSGSMFNDNFRNAILQ